MSTQYQVMAVGNALVDHEYALSDEQLSQTNLNKGSMTLVTHEEQLQLLAQFDELKINPSNMAGGGSAANSMFAIASMGGQCFYACRVADDGAGQFYLQDLQKSGVATSAVSVQHNEVTGSCVVCVTPDGERSMQTYLGTSSDIGEANIDFNIIAQSDWLYLEGYLAMSPSMHSAIAKLRQKASDHNVKVAVSFADPAVVNFAKDGLLHMLAPQDDSMNNIKEGVDLIFCNAEEAQTFTEQSQLLNAVRSLLKYCQTAVVTDGANGSIIAQQTEAKGITLIQVPTPAIKPQDLGKDAVLDTLGAGDSFAGAFMYALTQGHSLNQCGHFANQVASRVVQQFGPRLQAEDYRTIASQMLPKLA